jgi:hypothetical protein
MEDSREIGGGSGDGVRRGFFLPWLRGIDDGAIHLVPFSALDNAAHHGHRFAWILAGR